MQKKAVIVLCFLVMAALIPLSASANSGNRINDINGLGAVCSEENGKVIVVLRWNTEVINSIIGASEIKIQRTEIDNPNINSYDIIDKITSTEFVNGVTEWKDENVEVGKKYYYMITAEYGIIWSKHIETSITVQNPPPTLPPAPTPPPTHNNNQEDQGGTFERVVAALIEFPIHVVQKLGAQTAGLQPLDKLVFLSGASENEKKIAPWTPGEVAFIKLWYAAMLGLTMPLYIIAIAVSGFKIIVSSANPGIRGEAINSIWRWFGAAAIVLLAPLIVQTLLWITVIILDGIQFAFNLVAGTAGIGRDVSDWGGINFGDISLYTGSVLGTAIVKVMFVFVWVWFNAIYFVRKLVLTVMLCFTPFMALLWALNKNVNAVGIWMGELASNAFMPVAHALVLCVLLGFLDMKNISDGTWFQILIAVYIIIPLAEVIRNSLQGLLTRMSGINEEQTAGKALAAATGLGGILSLGRAVGTIKCGRNSAALDSNMPTGGGGSLTPTPVSSSSQIGFTSPNVPHTGVSDNIALGSSAGGTVQLPQSSGSFGAGRTIQNPFNTPPGDASTRPGVGQKSGDSSGSNTGQTANAPKISRPMETSVRAGSMAGKAIRYTGGAMINMVAGTIPGGREMAGLATQGMEMATRGITAASALGIQALEKSRQSGKGLGESLQEITGADSKLKAAGRGAILSAKTAHSPELGAKQANAYAAKTPGGLDGGRSR